MENMFQELKTKKQVRVPVQQRETFVNYCKARDIYPAGGLMTDNNEYQFFYID